VQSAARPRLQRGAHDEIEVPPQCGEKVDQSLGREAAGATLESISGGELRLDDRLMNDVPAKDRDWQWCFRVTRCIRT